MKKINKDLKYMIWLWIAMILAIIPTYAHHGNLLIDCGREAYYPTQILLGKVLYKDIFNIYGPFAYLLNAFLFKIFSTNLNVLYMAGCVCAFFIVNLTYLIAREFLSEFLSLSIALFTISIGVLNTNLFNFIFPYSYAMLYGITAFLASTWFVLRYQKNPDKNILLYLGCFFAGLSVTSKYDFLPYLIVILYAVFKIKRLKLKEYYYAFLSLLFAPVFCFGILFLQGLTISDLYSTVLSIKKMAQSKTLEYFYQTQGVYFHKKTTGVLFFNFFKTIMPLSLLTYGINASKKIIAITTISLSIILILCGTTPSSLVFLPIAIAIITILSFKKITPNAPLTILTLSSITLSIKVFWGLTTLNYGVFFAGFLLISIFALIFEFFPTNKQTNEKTTTIYILIIAAIFGYQNLTLLKTKSDIVSSLNGKIYTEAYTATSTNNLIKFIEKNTKKTDTIAIFPEGTMINFLTQRPADNTYSSLIPLYVETFGDKKIIEHFAKTEPEYIIFNNWNTKDYYLNYICTDYAVSFCNYVATNYTREATIDNGLRYLIFKKR